MKLIGKTTNNSKTHEAEFNVKGTSKVRLGQFVKVKLDSRLYLCKVTALWWKEKGSGKNREVHYQGKIEPVTATPRPFPPQTEIFSADATLIKKALGIQNCEGRIVLGNIIGTKIPMCIDGKALLKHLAILGQTGFGKTYTAMVLLEQMLDEGMTAVVIDPHGDFVWLAQVPEYQDKVVVVDRDISDDENIKLDDFYNDGKVTILNMLSIDDKLSREWIVNDVVSMLFNAAKHKEIRETLLVIDECHNFIPQRGNNECKDMCIRAIAEGRKFGMGMVLLTQRPAKLDKDALSQCANQIIHHVTNYNDINAITNSLEGVGKADKKNLQQLDVGEVLIMGVNLKTPLYVQIRKRKSPDREDKPIGVG